MIRNAAIISIISILALAAITNVALTQGAIPAIDAYGNRIEDARDTGFCAYQKRVQPFSYKRAQWYSYWPSLRTERMTRGNCLSLCMTVDIDKCWFIPEDEELLKQATYVGSLP